MANLARLVGVTNRKRLSVEPAASMPTCERVPLSERVENGLDRLDATLIALMRAVGRAIVDGFADYGAAHHGCVLSACSDERQAKPPTQVKRRGYAHLRLVVETGEVLGDARSPEERLADL